MQEALEKRIRDLEDQLGEKVREVENKETDIQELRKKLEAEIDRLRAEIDQIHNHHQRDLDNEREQYNMVKIIGFFLWKRYKICGKGTNKF